MLLFCCCWCIIVVVGAAVVNVVIVVDIFSNGIRVLVTHVYLSKNATIEFW